MWFNYLMLVPYFNLFLVAHNSPLYVTPLSSTAIPVATLASPLDHLANFHF